MRYDVKIVLERSGEIQSYQAVKQPVLLLGRSKSPKYLKLSFDSLQKFLPNLTRKTFKGLNHSGLQNKDEDSSPKLVANIIIEYFKK